MNKNRNRSKYSFANINLLGKCNFNCRWCLGKDLPEFEQFDTINQHFSMWPRFNEFIQSAKQKEIHQIYITGQNTDSLCYKHLSELIEYIKGNGFYVGIRSNGLLAEKHIETINECSTCLGEAVSFTVLSLDRNTHKKIVGHPNIPNWNSILPRIKVPLRVSIVIDRYNVCEFFQLIKFLSSFNNVKYVQVRRISTETRGMLLKNDIDVYEHLYETVRLSDFAKIKEYEQAVSYDIYGKECSFWRTISTTANSINYYCNGVLSNEYFIIEGYLKNKWQLNAPKEELGAVKNCHTTCAIQH